LRTEPVSERRLRSIAPERADVAEAASAELGELGALVGGRTVLSGDAVEIRRPWDGRLAAIVHRAGAQEVEETMRVSCREAFAPLVVVSPFEHVDEAIAAVDRSEFGLQAGIFTRDWPTIRRAFDRIEVGGLVVNDMPTFRIDHMPYGGVKQSGFGREGIRYAIEEMTELRLLALNDPG
jgi:acyl-CoA reductase-like NAD-dependent aldehyde dehydrogenase